MIAADFQSITVSQVDITFEIGVYTVTTLRGLQVDVFHLRILANGLPEYLSLIVAQVYAVNMFASVFALQVGIAVFIIKAGYDDALRRLLF